MVTLVQRQLRDAQRNKTPASPTNASHINQLGHEDKKDTETNPTKDQSPAADTENSPFHKGGK
jgi:hypothetical protein